MKRSELYQEAMRAIMRDCELQIDKKLEILEILISDKSGAEFSERLEAEKEATQA